MAGPAGSRTLEHEYVRANRTERSTCPIAHRQLCEDGPIIRLRCVDVQGLDHHLCRRGHTHRCAWVGGLDAAAIAVLKVLGEGGGDVVAAAAALSSESVDRFEDVLVHVHRLS